MNLFLEKKYPSFYFNKDLDILDQKYFKNNKISHFSNMEMKEASMICNVFNPDSFQSFEFEDLKDT